MKLLNAGISIVLATLAIAIAGLGFRPAFAETVVKSPAGFFEFHVDPWISLHHFAYHFVREEERDLKLRGRVPLTEEDRLALSPRIRSACASLVPAYRPYIEGSLLFDANTRGLARMLAGGPDALTDSAVRDALKACMPAYEGVLWQSHRAAAERLIQRLVVQLQAHEMAMAQQFADTLNARWPDTPIRVDVTPYANWAGAYTESSPAAITMSSYDQQVAGLYAFEILFHESGHIAAFEASLLAAANDALESAGLENDRFWHYVLFFVAGQLTSEVLDDPDYVPFSRAVGLTERERAAVYYRALEDAWSATDSFSERVLIAAQSVADDRQRFEIDQRE